MTDTVRLQRIIIADVLQGETLRKGPMVVAATHNQRAFVVSVVHVNPLLK